MDCHLMKTASNVMNEIDIRESWPAVVQRRAFQLRLRNRGLAEPDATEQAALYAIWFRDEHFSTQPQGKAEDEAETAAWNGYLQ